MKLALLVDRFLILSPNNHGYLEDYTGILSGFCREKDHFFRT